MKKAIKNHIINACEKHNLSEAWTDLMLEIFDSQMKGAAQHKRPRIIASVVSVSTSGMSRKIKFGYFDKSGIFCDITPLFAKLYGAKISSCGQGFTVHGCGMDMIFHVMDNVYYTITPKSEWSKYSDFCRYERF